MPFERPALADIEAHLQADVRTRLPGADPNLRRSYLGAMTRGVAGGLHEMYGFLDWIARQAFPDTAEGPELVRWSAIWGVERVAAASAAGTIDVAGATDSVVPAGTVWRSDAGQIYESTAEATLSDMAAAVPVRAAAAGAAGNAGDGAKMRLVSPIAGVVSEAAANGAIAGGADAEADGSLRRRLLLRLRNPPRGGTADDYLLWALSGHADVTRAWVRPLASGLGTVTVYLMTDGATDDGTPTDAVVSAVQAFIDERRPVTAEVTVAAPTAVALDIAITDLTPDSAAVQAAIQAEIEDLILRESAPGGTILLSHIREAISTAAGETDHTLSSPTADVTHDAGEIAVPGIFTWSTS